MTLGFYCLKNSGEFIGIVALASRNQFTASMYFHFDVYLLSVTVVCCI